MKFYIAKKSELFNMVDDINRMFPENGKTGLEQVEWMQSNANQKNLVVATNSPYIMAALNCCIMAKDVFDKTGKCVENYPVKTHVKFEDVEAYEIVKTEEGFVLADIKDDNNRLVLAEAVDFISDELNNDFMQMMELEDEAKSKE